MHRIGVVVVAPGEHSAEPVKDRALLPTCSCEVEVSAQWSGLASSYPLQRTAFEVETPVRIVYRRLCAKESLLTSVARWAQCWCKQASPLGLIVPMHSKRPQDWLSEHVLSRQRMQKLVGSGTNKPISPTKLHISPPPAPPPPPTRTRMTSINKSGSHMVCRVPNQPLWDISARVADPR